MKTGTLLSLLGIALASAAASEAGRRPHPGTRVVRASRRAGRGRGGCARGAADARTGGDAPRRRTPSSCHRSPIQGAGAFYRTAVDITNNTQRTASSRESSTATERGLPGLCTHPAAVIPLAAVDNFHTDDMVEFLAIWACSRRAPWTTPSARCSSPSTTFRPTSAGRARPRRALQRVNEANPARDRRIAYPGSLFFESATQSVVVVRDTSPPARPTGSLRTNLGVRNTDLADTDAPVSVDVASTTSPRAARRTGRRSATPCTVNDLQPGEVHLINNVFVAAADPRQRQLGDRPASTFGTRRQTPRRSRASSSSSTAAPRTALLRAARARTLRSPSGRLRGPKPTPAEGLSYMRLGRTPSAAMSRRTCLPSNWIRSAAS